MSIKLINNENTIQLRWRDAFEYERKKDHIKSTSTLACFARACFDFCFGRKISVFKANERINNRLGNENLKQLLTNIKDRNTKQKTSIPAGYTVCQDIPSPSAQILLEVEDKQSVTANASKHNHLQDVASISQLSNVMSDSLPNLVQLGREKHEVSQSLQDLAANNSGMVISTVANIQTAAAQSSSTQTGNVDLKVEDNWKDNEAKTIVDNLFPIYINHIFHNKEHCIMFDPEKTLGQWTQILQAHFSEGHYLLFSYKGNSYKLNYQGVYSSDDQVTLSLPLKKELADNTAQIIVDFSQFKKAN